jgi:hypothetical protein
MMIEMMRETAETKLRTANIPAVAFGIVIPEERLREIIATCLENGLFVESDGFFWSPSLMRRIKHLQEVSAKRREAGRASAASRVQRKKSKRSTNAEQALNKGKENKIKDPSFKEGEFEGKQAYGECGHVRLTLPEIAKLAERHTPERNGRAIEILDAWIESKPGKLAWFERKYSSAFSVLNPKNSWVWERVDAGGAKPAPRDFHERKAARQADVVERAQALRDAQERMISPRVKLEAK